MSAQQIALDCNACKSEQSMFSDSVPRFGTIVRIIGRIVLVPSLIGTAFAVMATILFATGAIGKTGQEAIEGFTLWVFIGVFSFISGLLGWLLLMKRKVYKCARCGFILDRA